MAVFLYGQAEALLALLLVLALGLVAGIICFLIIRGFYRSFVVNFRRKQ